MKERSGFTLIEMLVALGLCTILLFSLIYILNFTLKQMGKQQRNSLNISTGLIILSQITKDIHNSQALSLDPTTKALHLTINSQEATYVYQNNKVAKLKSNSTQYLSDEDQVTCLNFIVSNGLVSIELDQFNVSVYKRD